ncbi:pentatricopeptide repeat-containing protein At4g38010 [Zingiber officinale]|uniref:Pentatricopeptide repeat-containing protein n=1 Tax=Zingiber officinale TaxID=94328 RepID=A0A8J5FG54_ZINOF|nr:pentatricopeptide repeat-containing protein At4g38010 [Zingiber officinale]KAG6483425.1 hypothetical protein ZIOFF_060070 [Zingiber officinale]
MSVASGQALHAALLRLLRRPRSSRRCFQRIHALLLTSGLTVDSFAAADLAALLPACLPPPAAFATINHIHRIRRYRFPLLFNSLISGYARSDRPNLGIAVYKTMLADGIFPDHYTFPVVLKSCIEFSGVAEAKQIHGASVKLCFASDLFVQNALVHVYAICREYDDARVLFDEMPLRDVVSWTGLISAYVKGGLYREALQLFSSMDVARNAATFVSILVACGRFGDLNGGQMVHALVLKHECGLNLVAGNALLDMYLKCESLAEAKQIFDELPERDIVSWTSFISGLVQCKQPEQAIDMFASMRASGVEPDNVTLSSVLSACASLGSLCSGRWVHEYIHRNGIKWDVHLGTALVDMYAKCGCLDIALNTFSEMPFKNVSSWNAVIGALAMHGHGREALGYFEQMVGIGMNPNEVTFLAILSACSHSGLVEEGRCSFNLMTESYNLPPWIEHYGCMVDLLGRTGLLEEAYKLIQTMPMRPDVHIWGALLGACKAHGNQDLLQEILNHLLKLEPHETGVYVLLSNAYAARGRWADVTRVRKLMRQKGIKKETGISIVEVDGEAHKFVVGELQNLQEDILVASYTLDKLLQLDDL